MQHYDTLDCACRHCMTKLYASINKFLIVRHNDNHHKLIGWMTFLLTLFIIEKVIIIVSLGLMYVELL